jgi:hypothetical protein
MKRVLLISLSLVLALVAWSAVCADDGFYVIPAMRGKYAPVPKTGQTTAYDTGDDGVLQKGVASPTPRFTDNGNGTVTDKLTGLIWMKNAGALGFQLWADAMSTANNLHSGSIPGLNDGSQAGDWRLPNVRELQSLVDYGRSWPAFSGVPPFTGVQYDHYYWSSTNFGGSAWYVDFNMGGVYYNGSLALYYVWCVRGGQ